MVNMGILGSYQTEFSCMHQATIGTYGITKHVSKLCGLRIMWMVGG